jgi:hypothetical protein
MQRIAHTLSFALVLTGPGGAGPAKGAMQVELCADGATTLVWLDAEGNPIAPGMVHVKCIDCLILSAPVPDRAAGPLLIVPLPVVADLSPPVPPAIRHVSYLRPDTRGPPARESHVLRIRAPRPDGMSFRLSRLPLLEQHQAVPSARVIDGRTDS